MDPQIRSKLTPGASVKVTQQIAARLYSWGSDTVGVVVKYDQQQTGSWYAHSKNDKLWLDRLTIQKADGELITLNLDEYTVIEILSDASAATPVAVAATVVP